MMGFVFSRKNIHFFLKYWHSDIVFYCSNIKPKGNFTTDLSWHVRGIGAKIPSPFEMFFEKTRWGRGLLENFNFPIEKKR